MKSLLALTLLMAAAPAIHAANFLQFDPTPSPAIVNVGDTLFLNVDIFADDHIFGYQFDLLFPNFLNLDTAGITEEGFFAANGCCFGIDPSQIDNASGTVTNVLDAVFGPDGLPNNTFDTLIQFKFTAVAPGSGQFNLANIILSDDNFNSLSVDSPFPVDVTANVGAPIQQPPVDASAPEPAGILLLTGGLLVLIGARRRSGARNGQTCD